MLTSTSPSPSTPTSQQPSSTEPKPYASFPSPSSNLTTKPTKTNTYRIVCPNLNCQSLILRESTAEYLEKGVEEKLTNPSKPTSKDLHPGWKVTDMFTFDNIGFSHNKQSDESTPDSRTIKFLCCADCEIGPLGYHVVTEPKEYWIDATKVSYVCKK